MISSPGGFSRLSPVWAIKSSPNGLILLSSQAIVTSEVHAIDVRSESTRVGAVAENGSTIYDQMKDLIMLSRMSNTWRLRLSIETGHSGGGGWQAGSTAGAKLNPSR